MKMMKNQPTNLAILASGGRYCVPLHIQVLQNRLMDVVEGRIKRLIVNMPPRHGKSELISKYFPTWLLLNKPEMKIMLTSYESSFAASWGRKIRDLLLLTCPVYGIELTTSTESRIVTSKGGELNTAGVGGSITGKGADLLIIDDPVKNQEDAHSHTLREKAWDWFNSTAYTRLEPNGAIIIIQTRWHSDDLTGRLLKNNPDEWTVLNLPAIAKYDDQLGRAYGEALWSDRFPIEELNAIRNQLGEYWFAALYQQQPMPSDFQIFKQEWFENVYDAIPPCQMIIQTWDTAYKPEERNDYSVGATWGIYEKNVYLLDVFRGRIPFPALEHTVNMYYDKWKPKLVLIEDAGSGISLIQNIARKNRIPVRAIQPKNKEIRAHSVTPLFEQKRVFVPRNASFMHDFVIEHLEFPSGSHDDQVDTTTMSLEYLMKIINSPIRTGVRREKTENKTNDKYNIF